MRARVRRRIIVLTIGFLLVVLGGLIVVRLRAVPPDVVLLVRQIATEEGVDPDLAEALLRTESGGDIEARSRVGARGLMQLMPATAREIAGREGISLDGEDDLDDPRKNVRIGVIYLRDMLRRFEASEPLALAAYNAGPGRVQSWRRAHPDLDPTELLREAAFDETRGHVAKVLRTRDEIRRARVQLP